MATTNIVTGIVPATVLDRSLILHALPRECALPQVNTATPSLESPLAALGVYFLHSHYTSLCVFLAVIGPNDVCPIVFG